MEKHLVVIGNNNLNFYIIFFDAISGELVQKIKNGISEYLLIRS